MSLRQWLGTGVLYLFGHFVLYVVILRYVNICSSERAVFRYHAFSILALGAVLAGSTVLLSPSPSAAVIAGILSLHGIYSLSFLELWTLTEGSYSLSILACVSGGDLRELPLIGDMKRERRIESLRRLGLIQLKDGHMALTGSGRLVTRGFRLIMWLVNARSRA